MCFLVLDKGEEDVGSSVPVDVLSFNALSIPEGWLTLYTYPPGMGGHDATLSETSSCLSASITVLFEELSESLLLELSSILRFDKSSYILLTIVLSSFESERSHVD